MNDVILQANNLFKTAGFDYAICGGFAFDMFADKELRTHGDFDISVFKENKQAAVKFMQQNNWTVYGRFMEVGKPATQYLFYKIEDITHSFWDDCRNMWAIKPNCLPEMYKFHRLQGEVEVYSYKPCEWCVRNLEFIELEIDAREGDDFVLQENPRVTLPLEKAILYRDGVPYLAPEMVLFYKSDKFSSEHPFVKPKTEADFKTIMPLLSSESKEWLINAINVAYPDGHGWLDGLL